LRAPIFLAELPEYPMSRFTTRRTLLRGAAVASTLIATAAQEGGCFGRHNLEALFGLVRGW